MGKRAKSTLPRLRFNLRCKLGRHVPDYYALRAHGETWTTFLYVCMRCNRVVGNAHATREAKPATRDK